MKMRRLALPLIVIAGLQLTACDVDVEDEGQLPDVDVQGGELPDVDVEGPDVDVDTEEREITVPDVDVDPAEEAEQ